jgi:uncharacterized protein
VSPVFADTWYWVTFADPRDQWARVAKSFGESVGDRTLVTTDEVLVEFLAYFAGSSSPFRRRASEIVRMLLEEEDVEVIPQTRSGFLRGLALYERRPDKGYSLTDCISMEAMRARKITEVLTGDRHFAQEGFVLLLPSNRSS